jgi:hypothetical protein
VLRPGIAALLALAASPVVLTQTVPPPTTPAGTAAISGVVVDGTTRAPIPGALVALSRTPRQLTDAKGRFAFVKLSAASDYTIAASKAGYFEGTYGREAFSYAPGGPIPVRDGEWISDVRVVLWRPAAIAGTVVDERGEPVVSVWVRAIAQVRVAGRTHLAGGPATQTDDRGVYRIPNLPPGRYYVTVPSVQPTLPDASLARSTTGVAPALPPGAPTPESAASLDFGAGFRFVVGPYPTPPPPADGRSWAYPPAFHPGGPSIGGAATVDLQYGDERRGVDIKIEPVPAFRVSGTVRAPADALARLALRLVPAGLEALGQGSEAAMALVAPDGSFAFVNVPAGSYTLDATRAMTEITYGPANAIGLPSSSSFPPSIPGLVGSSWSSSQLESGPGGTGFVTRGGTSGKAFWLRTPIVVGGRDESNVSLTLRSASQIRGRIVLEADPSQPKSTTRPVITLVADPATGSANLGSPRSSLQQQDSTGDFAIDGLLDGSYFLRPSYASGWVMKSATWNERDHTDAPFDATGGQDINGVVVTFTNAVAVVSGQVQDGQGRPAVGAAVIVFPVERRLWTDYGLRPTRIKSTSVSRTGGFRISPLPAGDYYVIAVPGAEIDAWQDADFFKNAELRASRVTLGWGETKTQDLVVGGTRGK